jgi:hypothetical protein
MRRIRHEEFVAIAKYRRIRIVTGKHRIQVRSIAEVREAAILAAASPGSAVRARCGRRRRGQCGATGGKQRSFHQLSSCRHAFPLESGSAPPVLALDDAKEVHATGERDGKYREQAARRVVLGDVSSDNSQVVSLGRGLYMLVMPNGERWANMPSLQRQFSVDNDIVEGQYGLGPYRGSRCSLLVVVELLVGLCGTK